MPLDKLHFERNLITRIEELERRLMALEHTELSGVAGPTGATGATGATGPAGPGTPAGPTTGDIVYYVSTTPTALNIGTATQLLQTNAGATAPEWVTAGAANLANRTRTFLVQAVGAYNATDVAQAEREFKGWPMIDAKATVTWAAFKCPSDYASTLTVTPVLISNANGDIYARLQVYYGNVGEAYNTHSTDTGYLAETLVASQWDLGDAGSLGSIDANDYVEIQYTRDGVHASDTVGDTVWIVGFLISYTADM